jgi:hypothetical protein
MLAGYIQAKSTHISLAKHAERQIAGISAISSIAMSHDKHIEFKMGDSS